MKKDHFLGLSEEGFHRVVYREWGLPSDKNPIICVHGLTRNGQDFNALSKYLSNKGRHLYCPDVVGRGDSDWLKNPLHYTYEQYLSDMVAMIARTGSKEVDWIGTSMGGLIGMVIAAQQNTPIRRLVLNDIGPHIPVKGLARLSKFVGHDPEFRDLNEAKKYFKEIYAEFGILNEEEWQTFTEYSVKEKEKGRYITTLDQGIKIAPAKSKFAWNLLLHPFKSLEGTIFDVDLWDIWHKINCPVLVIHGKHSDILLEHTILKMQKSHHNVSVIDVPNAGHAPALIANEYHGKIYEWLETN